MKHGKRPTRGQRRILERWKLNPENWLVAKNEIGKLTLIHRNTGQVRTVSTQ